MYLCVLHIHICIYNHMHICKIFMCVCVNANEKPWEARDARDAACEFAHIHRQKLALFRFRV